MGSRVQGSGLTVQIFAQGTLVYGVRLLFKLIAVALEVSVEGLGSRVKGSGLRV